MKSYNFNLVILFNNGDAYGIISHAKLSIRYRYNSEPMFLGSNFTMDMLKKQYPNTSKRHSNHPEISKYIKMKLKIPYRKEKILHLLS